MNTTIEYWKTQLGSLPSSDRAELAHFLLLSLDPETEDVEAEWDAVASKRVAEIIAGRATGRPVEEFLAELRERHP